jgi:hypothetical protein
MHLMHRLITAMNLWRFIVRREGAISGEPGLRGAVANGVRDDFGLRASAAETTYVISSR